MNDSLFYLEAGEPILVRFGLPNVEPMAKRAFKAIDIESNRIAESDFFAFDGGAIAEVSSDSRKLKWSVTVNPHEMTCKCNCEDKQRHEEMNVKTGDRPGSHFCKHAIAVLLRLERQGVQSGESIPTDPQALVIYTDQRLGVGTDDQTQDNYVVCERKVRHASFNDALHVLTTAHAGDKGMAIYNCSRCLGFHLGHLNGRPKTTLPEVKSIMDDSSIVVSFPNTNREVKFNGR
jgi:hypothetical protein